MTTKTAIIRAIYPLTNALSESLEVLEGKTMRVSANVRSYLHKLLWSLEFSVDSAARALVAASDAIQERLRDAHLAAVTDEAQKLVQAAQDEAKRAVEDINTAMERAAIRHQNALKLRQQADDVRRSHEALTKEN